MAAITGFEQLSISAITSLSDGDCGGLPNSVMSAPATNVRPAHAITIAFTAGSALADFTLSKMPRRTAALSAFTGGELTVTMATSSWRSRLTTSFTAFSLVDVRSDSCCFALRNLIPHLDRQGYFEERPLSTRQRERRPFRYGNASSISTLHVDRRKISLQSIRDHAAHGRAHQGNAKQWRNKQRPFPKAA